MTTESDNDMIGVGDVAKACGISPRSVTKLVNSGAIVAPYRIPCSDGKPVLRWKRGQFKEWLESTRQAPQTEK